MIYLDNSATTYPKPESVRRTASMALSGYGANPGRGGYEFSIKTAEAVYGARKEAADFFNAPSVESAIVTLNCTHAINMVLKGILKEGDHVVMSCLEHNAVCRPLQELRKKGVLFTIAKVFIGDDAKTVEAFKECIKSNTKLVVCTHASNVWGIRLPIAELAELAHSKGALFMVDAAQTAGLLPIDVKRMGIDFLCCAGHKGLYGPMGTGLLVFGGESRPCTIIEGGTGSFSASFEQPEQLPDRYESGTGNTPGIITLGKGINFVKQKGIERIYAHEMALIQLLYGKLSNIAEIELYTPIPRNDDSVPVLSFNLRGMGSEELAAKLGEKGIAVRAGLHCSPLAHQWAGTLESGAVRVSLSVFNNEQQIERLVQEINFIKNKKST